MKTFKKFYTESLELFDKETKGVFRNPNTSVEELKKHSYRPEHEIRSATASHPNADSEILDRLSRDDHHSVKLAVATNPNTTADALHDLSHTKSSYVKHAVASNPSTSELTLRSLVKRNDTSPQVLDAIMRHKSSTKEIKNMAKNHPNVDNKFKTDFKIK